MSLQKEDLKKDKDKDRQMFENKVDVCITLHPMMTGISVWRRLNSAMEMVTETWSRVRHVSLVGMNSSKLDISSGVAGPWLSSTISTMTQQKESHYVWNKYRSTMQGCTEGRGWRVRLNILLQKQLIFLCFTQVNLTSSMWPVVHYLK